MVHLGCGVSRAYHHVRLPVDAKEDTMKKRHPPKPKRVKRKKGVISRVISGSTKAVSKAWR